MGPIPAGERLWVSDCFSKNDETSGCEIIQGRNRPRMPSIPPDGATEADLLEYMEDMVE